MPKYPNTTKKKSDLLIPLRSKMKAEESDLTIRNCNFAFKCTAIWDALLETDDDLVRFCNGCQKEVFKCITDDMLSNYVRLNRCVAIYKESIQLEPLIGSIEYERYEENK